MAKPTPPTIPEWSTSGTKNDPGLPKQQAGWDSKEKPRYDWFNWILNRGFEWLRFLYDDVVSVGHTDAGAHKADVINTLQIVDAAVTEDKIRPAAVVYAKVNDSLIGTGLEKNATAETIEANSVLTNMVNNPDGAIRSAEKTGFLNTYQSPVYWFNGGGTPTDNDPLDNGLAPTVPYYISGPIIENSSGRRISRSGIGTFGPPGFYKSAISNKLVKVLAADQDYILMARVFVEGYLAGDLKVAVIGYDAAGVYVGTGAGSIDVNSNQDAEYYQVSGTIPSGSVYCRVKISTTAAWSATQFFVDKITCIVGTTRQPIFADVISSDDPHAHECWFDVTIEPTTTPNSDLLVDDTRNWLFMGLAAMALGTDDGNLNSNPLYTSDIQAAFREPVSQGIAGHNFLLAGEGYSGAGSAAPTGPNAVQFQIIDSVGGETCRLTLFVKSDGELWARAVAIPAAETYQFRIHLWAHPKGAEPITFS